MRTLLKITMPDLEAANRAISDGRIQKLFESFTKEYKPEDAYFYSEDGTRCASFLFDLKDPSQIPAICEPFFFALNAKVVFVPVMNAEELSKGLDAWSKKSQEWIKGTALEQEKRSLM